MWDETYAIYSKNYFFLKELLLPLKISELPWQVGMNIFFYNDKQFLLIIDYLSKYVEIIIILQNFSTSYVVNCIKYVCDRRGIPKTVITANDIAYLLIEKY